MKWSELERRQPGLADLGRRRLLAPGVVLVATIRRDGTPRLSPVEPFVMDGDLWLSMLWQSTKAADLIRDPRVLVHGVVTNRDGREGEFKVRGHAGVRRTAVSSGVTVRRSRRLLAGSPRRVSSTCSRSISITSAISATTNRPGTST
jgi:hypothetical protein